MSTATGSMAGPEAAIVTTVSNLRGRRAAAGSRGGRLSGTGLDDLVFAGGGLAEAAHRERRESPIDLVQPEIDLAIGQGKQASSLTIALDQKRPEPLDLEHPESLGDAELEPMHVDDALDRAPIRRAQAVADGRQIHGAVGHEPFAVRGLGETGLAHDQLGARALEPAA